MINKVKLSSQQSQANAIETQDIDRSYPIMLNYFHKDEKYEEDSSLDHAHKVIDSILHSCGTRVSYMVRGKCCFTFELPDEAEAEDGDKKSQAKLIYCIDSDDIRFVYHRNKTDVFV